MVLITSIAICAIGIPAVWLLINPTFAATAAIRIAPIIPSILFSDKDSEGVIPMYQNFKNTQADLIKSDQVLHRVADDLMDKKLKFFEDTDNPVVKLRQALTDEDITVIPGRKSELLMITMVGQNTTETTQIVDAFVKAYMAIEVSKETEGGDRKLTILESERKVLADKLQKQRETIRQMAEEYGSVVLTGRQEMMLQRVADLQAELTKIQTRRITLETQQQLLVETSVQEDSPGTLFKLRYEFINANPTFQVLSSNITQLDQGLIIAQQTLAPTNPELKRKAELLETMKNRLEEKRNELGKTFDDLITKEITKNHEEQLNNLTVELTQIRDYEKRLQDMLAKENSETIGLGRKHLAIQDQQEQLALTKELYDTVRRRVQVLEMERKRPARISVAYNASVSPVPNKRIKYTLALVFGSLATGCFLALLMGRADHSLYTPNDITQRVGVRIIGTTTNTDHFDKPELPEQIYCDYQTIRANLGLLNGDNIPNKLVVTSAGMRDGKTTFAINFATSLAKANKKVLLIDGDLRKPDIRRLLDLPESPRGLNDVLFNKNTDSYIHSIPSIGLDILATDKQNMSDSLELLSLPHVNEYVKNISTKYDHVIIDTPPVLAFPDALVWAKMADGVILTSFSGRTTENDLKETLKRLEQIKVKVLGTVFHNVSSNYSYNRYAYGYYTNQAEGGRNHRKNKKIMLLMPIKEFRKNHKDSKSPQKNIHSTDKI
jgi:capsular exopolysaccharide synthesis family protein